MTVYYPQGAQLAEVKRLVREREPVNIGMKRRYDQQKMQEYFGGFGAGSGLGGGWCLVSVGCRFGWAGSLGVGEASAHAWCLKCDECGI